MSALALQGVSKRHGAVVALDDVTLEVGDGRRLAILGPSGSGKTTLLRLAAGFDTPDEGRIVLGGDTLAQGGDAVPAHRRRVGYVAQDGALFPHLSVAENVGFGLGRREAGRDATIADLLRLVDLDPRLGARRPDALSGGQQQRVAVARALAQRPRLMLLDEPFSALDTGLRAATRDAVGLVLRTAGITTILVTHDRTEALSFADEVAVIRDGRLLQVGPPRDVYLRPCSRAVAELLGDAIVLPATVAAGWARCALGSVPVGDTTVRGPAEIILRPEQIAVSRCTKAATANGTKARLTALTFGGPTSAVTIVLDGPGVPAWHELALTLGTAVLSGMEVGCEVALAVTGQGVAVMRCEPG